MSAVGCDFGGIFGGSGGGVIGWIGEFEEYGESGLVTMPGCGEHIRQGQRSLGVACDANAGQGLV